MEHFFRDEYLVPHMCKFLNYEEQFKLTQVSSDLEHIIVNYVWKTNLDIIEITMMEMSFVVSDTLKKYNEFCYDYFARDIWRRNSFILTSKNMDIFLNLNVKNITKLQIIKHGEDCNTYESIKNALPLRKKFPNLTELSCCNIEFEKMDLQKVSVNCAKLETLVLSNCTDLNGRLLEIGLDIDIQILKAMQNMNNLCMCTGEYTFSIIKKILNQLKLKQLTLEGTMLNDYENINNDLNLSNLKYYNKLNIHGFCYQSKFLYFQTNFLPDMENLCNLSLSCREYVFIKKEFFNVLLESCKSLTHLELDGFTINDFIALPSLNELKLQFCKGLTYSHLKTILSEMHLKCFKSRWTEYNGDFVCFPISPSLQKIDFYSYSNDLINLLQFNEANLMNLTKLTYNGEENVRVSNFPKNLKVVNIERGGLFAEDCLKLKYLQEIRLKGDIAISDFFLLLKHENLQKISFWTISYSSYEKSIALEEMKNLHTNLCYLKMVRYNKEFISDILLDLLNTNTKLSFACGVNKVESIIDTLIDGKFPKRFKNIKIHGVSIDCNSIRNKCKDTVNQMKRFIEADELEYTYFLLK